MKYINIIGIGFLGGFSGTIAGAVLGSEIYTGPHKYGIIVVAGSGLIIGSLIGGWIGNQL